MTAHSIAAFGKVEQGEGQGLSTLLLTSRNIVRDEQKCRTFLTLFTQMRNVGECIS